MSHDVVALLAESPDHRSLLDAMAAAGPGLRVRAGTARTRPGCPPMPVGAVPTP
ncbi:MULTISPECIES: hypothetical protein [unclassified Nocardiopsis]|uniref:hypothetical protein n=1 Tax=unclassified Nocardiopsis TaxID=2649073 RepID=UPI000A865BF5|nr:hypothetical protein [Nocardiopsis sp. TSRI0078]